MTPEEPVVHGGPGGLGAAVPGPGTSPEGGPGPSRNDPHVHALLVVRAWRAGPDGAGLAARVWSTPDVGTEEPVVRLVDSAEAVVDAVQDWLRDVGSQAS